MQKYKIILYYNYTFIDDSELLLGQQRELCKDLGLKGRLIIAKEGINGTFEGTEENVEKYVEILKSDPRFADTHMKYSDGDGTSFPKLSIKVRDEIVSAHLGDEDLHPKDTTGKYIQAEELHQWFQEGKEFYIVDMRNDYEHKVGHFEDSLLPSFENFRDLPRIIKEIEHLKGKTVVTVCTGGVRCEKASGYLVKKGFADVYQLFGGIVTYMEKYPNQNFKGKLYVFDGRTTMGFNTEDPEHEVIGNCDICGKSSDHYIDCNYVHCKNHRHMICCEECFVSEGGYCCNECKELDAKKAQEIMAATKVKNVKNKN